MFPALLPSGRSPKSAQRLNTRYFFAALLLLTGVSAFPAHGEDPDRELRDVERAIEEGKGRKATLEKKAASLARNIRGIRKEMIKAARNTQEREEVVVSLKEHLDTLEQRLDEKRQALRKKHYQFGNVLAALERLAVIPEEILLVLPARPVDTIRSINLIRFAVPKIESKAEELRRELTVFSSLRAEMVRRRGDYLQETKALDKERRQLGQLLKQKQQLESKTRAESKKEQERLRKLGTQAKNLRELLARLEHSQVALKPPIEGISSFRAARGTLPLPARGRLIRRYGEETEFGVPSKGLYIETLKSAQVVAPFDGQIVFAGPFRGYGLLLIIRHSEGYHTLLAGLFRIDGAVGQWVLAGEPVGAMGRPAAGNPTLYVELRREGQAINLLPWLATGREKVSG
ncbi:MAG: peptidoglycan DD-metalloendopeptidase family protein [Alphaproteobacteria bacterium]|nr:peptidoglycan DD-metalloendopeptidase family protein [Alphaproteobacteria bacterium]